MAPRFISSNYWRIAESSLEWLHVSFHPQRLSRLWACYSPWTQHLLTPRSPWSTDTTRQVHWSSAYGVISCSKRRFCLRDKSTCPSFHLCPRQRIRWKARFSMDQRQIDLIQVYATQHCLCPSSTFVILYDAFVCRFRCSACTHYLIWRSFARRFQACSLRSDLGTRLNEVPRWSYRDLARYIGHHLPERQGM